MLLLINKLGSKSTGNKFHVMLNIYKRLHHWLYLQIHSWLTFTMLTRNYQSSHTQRNKKCPIRSICTKRKLSNTCVENVRLLFDSNSLASTACCMVSTKLSWFKKLTCKKIPKRIIHSLAVNCNHIFSYHCLQVKTTWYVKFHNIELDFADPRCWVDNHILWKLTYSNAIYRIWIQLHTLNVQMEEELLNYLTLGWMHIDINMFGR